MRITQCFLKLTLMKGNSSRFICTSLPLWLHLWAHWVSSSIAKAGWYLHVASFYWLLSFSSEVGTVWWILAWDTKIFTLRVHFGMYFTYIYRLPYLSSFKFAISIHWPTIQAFQQSTEVHAYPHTSGNLSFHTKLTTKGTVHYGNFPSLLHPYLFIYLFSPLICEAYLFIYLLSPLMCEAVVPLYSTSG